MSVPAEHIKEVDIIGVPIDWGVRELGLKLGPDTLRSAGLADVLCHEGFRVWDQGDVDPPMPISGDADSHRMGAIAAYCDTVSQVVADSIARGRLPVCLGGDHSMAIGTVAGAAKHVKRLGCVWLDAHPDANTPETSPSGNVHGMPVAVLLGTGARVLVDVGFPGRKLIPENIAILGTRDMDEGEVAFLKRQQVRMFTVYDVLEQGLPHLVTQTIECATKNTDGVHVSLDLDVLHEDIAPGVGLPSHSGFDMREAIYICRRLAESCHITSIDIVSMNPVRDIEMRTAHCAIELLMTLLGRSYSFSYDQYCRDQSRGSTGARNFKTALRHE